MDPPLGPLRGAVEVLSLEGVCLEMRVRARLECAAPCEPAASAPLWPAIRGSLGVVTVIDKGQRYL